MTTNDPILLWVYLIGGLVGMAVLLRIPRDWEQF